MHCRGGEDCTRSFCVLFITLFPVKGYKDLNPLSCLLLALLVLLQVPLLLQLKIFRFLNVMHFGVGSKTTLDEIAAAVV